MPTLPMALHRVLVMWAMGGHLAGLQYPVPTGDTLMCCERPQQGHPQLLGQLVKFPPSQR